MRRAALVLLIAALGLTLAPVLTDVATPKAAAAPSDIVAVVVEGTGYGHGRGMSQWGAYGWAVDQGKNWEWILDHYYGGTSTGSVNTSQKRLRVRLLGFDGLTTVGITSGSGSVTGAGVTRRSLYAKEISPNRFEIYGSSAMACPAPATLTVPDGTIASGTSGLKVRQIQTFLNAYQGGTPLAVDGDFGNLTRTRLIEWQRAQELSPDGVWDTADARRARAQIASSSGSASWTRLTTVNGPVTFTTGNGETSSVPPDAVLGVCDGAGKVTHYRGEIEVHNGSGDTNAVVNDVKTEDYLRGVVPKEISASWADAGGGKGIHAVRAQAVAARSYALAYSSSRWLPAQICDSQSCQVYFGSATRATAGSPAIAVEDARTDRAIKTTNGKVRKWPNGSVVSTEFSASNGPRTAGNTFPPVDDAPGDRTANNPNHKWTRVLPAAQIAKDYGLGTLTAATMVDGAAGYDGIWWNDVRLVGTSRTVEVSAWDFMSKYRSAFGGLKSPGFTVRTVTRDTTNKSFAMIGDSVANSIAGSFTSEFTTLINGMFSSATIDVRDGRCIAYRCKSSDPYSNGAETAASLPKNLDLVVVELGYNQVTSGGMAADIDTMMRALTARGVKQVAWVNLATSPGTRQSTEYAKRNAALSAARSRWSNLTILDWNQASTTAESSRWFQDHAHLEYTGQAQFALWLRAQIQTLAPPAPAPQRLAPPKRLEIPVVGRAVTSPTGAKLTVPATASAVALNVTSVKPTTEGYLTVWPCGMSRPLASSVNYIAGATMGNGVIAPIGKNGSVCLYSYADTDAVVDINGWFDSAASGSQFIAATPDRLVDTRYGVGAPKRRVDPSSPLSIAVTGRTLKNAAGSTVTIPADADAVAINITSVKPVGEGYVTVWPCGIDRPVVSSVNYDAGTVIANGAIVSVGSGGKICLHSYAPTDVVVDVVGWFNTASTTPTFVSANPERVVDTRYGIGAPKRRVSPTNDLSIPMANRQLTVDGQRTSVPADAKAVAMNVTAVGSATSGYATVWPCGTAQPYTSSLNYDRGVTTAGNVIAPIGSNGSVCLHTYVDAHYVVDVFGWFTAADEYVSAVPDRLVDTRIGVGPRPV